MNKPIHRSAGTDLSVSPNAAEIDQILVYFGCALNDIPKRLRAGELLTYRQGRKVSLARARRAKRQNDTEQMTRMVRAAWSQHRVVMRRLRQFRTAIPPDAPAKRGVPPGAFWWG